MNSTALHIHRDLLLRWQTIHSVPQLLQFLNYKARAETLDALEFEVLDRIATLAAQGIRGSDLNVLATAAKRFQRSLEKVDQEMFSLLRQQIIAYKTDLQTLVRHYLPGYCERRWTGEETGYDELDVFMNGLLMHGELPPFTAPPNDEMVRYQKTPAAIIFQLVERAAFGPNDIFIDLGSGLGQPVLLVNLLSGCKSRGIEIDQHYCDFAIDSAAALHVSTVQFQHTDVRVADLTEGTVFFLFSSFVGSILAAVLERLRVESLKRRIRIFTFGPCSLHVSQQSWLQSVPPDVRNLYCLYEFISLPPGLL